MINYRYQAIMEDPGLPAFSPRLSLILPTEDRGDDSAGLQVNLPFSKQRGDMYFHWNAGVTWLPRAKAEFTRSCPEAECRMSLVSPHLAASGIYRVRPMFNLMLESVVEFEQFAAEAGGKARDTFFTLSPGARGGWNLGDHQLIVGFAVPVTWGGGESHAGGLLYLSYELPFRK